MRFACMVASGLAILSACGNARSTVANDASAVTRNAVDTATTAVEPVESPSSSTVGVLASCPSTLGAPGRPAGTRAFGKTTPASLPLSDAAIGTVAVQNYDPALGNLDENEADDIEGKIYATAATYSYSPNSDSVSLACRYGKTVLPLSGEAMLLIPLKPQWAKCRFVAAKGTRPASMTCRASKPEE